jgi:pyruvate-formate lyase-activating enzyme
MGFHLVYADSDGEIRVHSELAALGRNGRELWEFKEEEMILLPPGADLFQLKEALPIGMDEMTGEPVVLTGEDNETVAAVAAFLPMGYARLMVPAWERVSNEKLPLYSYTAVAGGEDGRLYVAAQPIEVSLKWDPFQYPRPMLESLIPDRKGEFPKNRILEQLAYCSLEYHCLTAQNIFFRRWEAGIPVSRSCNARCLGCISEQPAECCPSPQRRVNFVPEVREIVELAVAHLEDAEDGIISFGQGCEGEPLTAGGLLTEAVKMIREQTAKGTININTNGGYNDQMEALVHAGLDSVRVSLFSADPVDYTRYHRPQGYTLENVRKSLHICRDAGVDTSLNLLVYPGFTDQPSQMEQLKALLREGCINRIQFRNLNIDPEQFSSIFIDDDEGIGLAVWLKEIRSEFPQLMIGSFSHPHRPNHKLD